MLQTVLNGRRAPCQLTAAFMTTAAGTITNSITVPSPFAELYRTPQPLPSPFSFCEPLHGYGYQ
ncbi:hypothetical protein BDW22DRAFT_1358079 [Trametopsis cervina]|nr:hypothetical protein BDW22DRAFT_1358079 [Trametopsis cervina]